MFNRYCNKSVFVTRVNFKTKFNSILEFEINAKLLRYKNENNIALFDKIITHESVLCEKQEDGEYQIREVFK